MAHLLTGCSFLRAVWHEVLSWLRLMARHPDAEDDIVDWWHRMGHSVPASARKGTSTAIMLVAWCISKHRNTIIFDNAPLSLPFLVGTI
jgi:hypothetical protein